MNIKITKRFDPWILISTLVMVSIGVIMSYSASAIIAMERYGDHLYFLKRQIAWVGIGSVLMVSVMLVDYEQLKKATLPLFAASVFMLVLILFPVFSKEVGGARRWLVLGPFIFQPSELVKVSLILYMAHTLSRKADKIEDFTVGYLPNLIVLGALAMLIAIQPDLGTAIVITVVVSMLLFVAGVRMKHTFLTLLCSLPVLAYAVMFVPYRKRRILAFLNPWDDPTDSGFQIIQSLLAIARGGVTGLGLGNSKQKLFYLPEPHTDFIFSVIGEELGFIGVAFVLLCFIVFLWRGLRVAMKVDDLYGRYLAVGFSLLISVQALINIGVVVGALPTKGLPLPFISVGGSSLIVSMVSAGILLNVSNKMYVKKQP
ncbi:MAG: putative lipid II flippase FtsW [Nitrospinae bacterium]|nr:putative lipid II flippase FtsW [Nitrospinota bacterium]